MLAERRKLQRSIGSEITLKKRMKASACNLIEFRHTHTPGAVELRPTQSQFVDLSDLVRTLFESRLDHSEPSVQINLEAANLHRHWITPDRCHKACMYMLKKACDPSLDLANWMPA